MSSEHYEKPSKSSMEQVQRAAGSDTQSSSNNSVKGEEDIGEPLAWTFSKWLTDVRGFGGIQHNKHLAVTYRGLTVQGRNRQKAFGNTVWSEIDPRNLAASFRKDRSPPRVLLHDFSGQVLPGEMMLVVGRPGSGCTTFMKALANKRQSFSAVTGDVRYGTLDAEEAAPYRQQILFNGEEDMHFPTLAVGEMMQFTLKTKTPRVRPEELKKRKKFVQDYQESILRALGIHHTTETLIGNEFVRGVSGGERKRVSIAEVLAGQSPVQFWDNATRGLDASTALDFTQALRTLAHKEKKTIVASFYQAGNGIFDQFDKVTVIAEGRRIYYGPRHLAKGYFEDLGFACPPGANIADFLSSVTVPSERQIRPGYERRVPTSAEDFETMYNSSKIHQHMMEEVVEPSTLTAQTEEFRAAVRDEVHKSTLGGKLQPYTVSIWTQISACTARQFRILAGDRTSLLLKVAQVFFQALITGSVFYKLNDTTSTAFTRPGALFYPVLYFCMQAMSETTASFMGRPILSRQKDFGLYRPSAYTIAAAITDIPMALVQVSLLSLMFYFIVAFQMDAAKFFIFWVNLLAASLCFNAQFRSIGACCNSFGNAAKISGFLSMVMMIYSGYLVPFTSMHPWFRWIFYLNPASYAYETLMVNEWSGLELACVAPSLVPSGPGYNDTAHQACTLAGATAAGSVDGMAYLRGQYGYAHGHLWRGFGVVVGFWLFYTVLTAVGYERMKSQADDAGGLVFKRGGESPRARSGDEEQQQRPQPPSGFAAQPALDDATSAPGAAAVGSVYAWEDVDYVVNAAGGEKRLLDRVSGFVKPGQIVALMGSSGAGKTTLLDVLAQRKDSGTVRGEMTLDGRALDESFQRSAGYCEQVDIHEPAATVREALEFSALLRQPRSTPVDERLQYVDFVVDLLELRDIQDALVGTQGEGLSVEQRKRLTIGVELVAKPSVLFLDEPTSGLDGQAAYNIVRFMKKLAAAGQAVLCTIHQPSAQLFEKFDALLLLCKGGRTAYFGETGENSSVILEYFAANGAVCPPDLNPAEFIIDVVQGKMLKGVDWHEVWKGSQQHVESGRELDLLKAECASRPPAVTPDGLEYASTLGQQLKIVIRRHVVALWRKPDYIWNKIMLHVVSALFAGFTFWQVGNGTFDLQLRLFAIFNFVFVSVGVINQLQPLFLENRNIFEAREKKSKTYDWKVFVTAQLVAEIPWLVICGTLYFACFYFTVGFPVEARVSGQVYFQMILFELLYTALGQAIAVCSPNAYFASLVNPLILGTVFINFAGVLVPYSGLDVFWKYWMYWLNPYTYLIQGLVAQIFYAVEVECKSDELATFAPPPGSTCGAYMEGFLSSNPGYLVDPQATDTCQYCKYNTGGDYAKTFNINGNYYGWRGTGITALFTTTTYLSVYLAMKLRSKKTKGTESKKDQVQR